MRNIGVAALHGYWWPVALYAVATAILLGAAVLPPGLKQRNRGHLAIVLCCCAPPSSSLEQEGLSISGRWDGISRLRFPHCCSCRLRRVGAVVATEWVGQAGGDCSLSLFSCSLCASRLGRAKDNYRAAATVAKTTLCNGQPVWWNAAGRRGAVLWRACGHGAATSGEALYCCESDASLAQTIC